MKKNRKIYINASGQLICLEIYREIDVLYSFIKGAILNNIIEKPKSVDAILRFMPAYRYKNITEREPKIYFCRKYPLKGIFIARRKYENNILNGVCLLKSKMWKRGMLHKTQNIILHKIIRFSFEASAYTKSLLLHASSIEKNKKGYLFIGRGGSGKSTICKILKNKKIIHDDTTVVRKRRKGYSLSPIFNSEKAAITGPGLKSILFIKKSKKNSVERLSLKQSFVESLEHCRTLGFCGDAVQIYEDLLALFKRVPAYRLYFKKEPSFWKLIK